MAILYTDKDRVKARLAGKVRFTEEPDDEPDRMPETLLDQLIEEAESDVEQDLSQRYETPFATVDGQGFASLPDRPTKLYIKTLCDLKATMRVLETDFGGGSTTDGSKYYENVQKRYYAMKNKQLQRHKELFNKFMYPPLPQIKLAPHNEAADDGYAGEVHVSSMGDGEFPRYQINDPSENFWNGEIDEF